MSSGEFAFLLRSLPRNLRDLADGISATADVLRRGASTLELPAEVERLEELQRELRAVGLRVAAAAARKGI
jgi:hypothetical protein